MSTDLCFAEVAMPVPLRHTFTYRIPEELKGRVVPGCRVTVPFGRRTAAGFVVSLSADSPLSEIREIRSMDGESPLFRPELMTLARWMADYYVCSIGEVLKAALPGGGEPTSRRRARATAEAPGVKGPVLEEAASAPAAPPTLNPEQERVVSAVDGALRAGRHATFLLLGITGSGKTEIYLRAAALAEASGGQTLILVPEIVLSPQMVRQCEDRFAGRVVVWHSALPLGRRKEAWRRVNDGSATIVVGARSAVLAPFRNLRLVVVDEEHETAYKQDEAPRYHGRDVAVYRAHLNDAAVILGSATPSLESYHNALAGKYTLLKLPRRIDDRPTPRVEVVSLTRGGASGGEEDRPAASPVLSPPLVMAIRDRLARAEQTIIFLNRRGHSTHVVCGECGHVARCPHCDISLTWHADRNALRCHYCAYLQREFDVCPECSGSCFVYRGVGTQRVEAEIRRMLPEARTRRLDFDSTRRRGALEGIFREFRDRKVDILLGTQMVARGLDFPGVTLVGVINADTQLNLPDFRSAERTFQLLTQVAGRAGRGREPGEVVIQTFAAGHYAIEAARAQDFEAFYNLEMTFRREVEYPPITRMVNCLIDGKDEPSVIDAAERLGARMAERIRRESLGVEILGPAPQSLSRLKGKYRWHVTLKGRAHRDVRRLAETALEPDASIGAGVRITLDVDPMSLL